MAVYSVEIVSKAEKEYLRLLHSVKSRFQEIILSLQKDSRPFGSCCIDLSLSIQGEVKRRPFPYFPFGPDIASVTMDDALYNGKADSCALKIFLGVHPVERVEHFPAMSRIESSTVVSYVIDILTILFQCADFDTRVCYF